MDPSADMKRQKHFHMKKCDARSNNRMNGRYRGPTECNSGFDHRILCGIISDASSLVLRSNAVSNNIIQESWNDNVAVWPFRQLKYSKRYAGCRQKACTVPERLVGMGKSEWGLGMLHNRLGVVLLFLAYRYDVGE